jgi:hypothetical protein
MSWCTTHSNFRSITCAPVPFAVCALAHSPPPTRHSRPSTTEPHQLLQAVRARAQRARQHRRTQPRQPHVRRCRRATHRVGDGGLPRSGRSHHQGQGVLRVSAQGGPKDVRSAHALYGSTELKLSLFYWTPKHARSAPLCVGAMKHFVVYRAFCPSPLTALGHTQMELTCARLSRLLLIRYPVCTIRNTPSFPIHCIVWAKFLFGQLFGVADDENDVTPDTNDPELAEAAAASAKDAAASASAASAAAGRHHSDITADGDGEAPAEAAAAPVRQTVRMFAEKVRVRLLVSCLM